MIDLSKPNEWQHIDPETGILFPWYTKAFLDELATWELSRKAILEIGAGASTLWWVKKAGYVYSFETNDEWYETINSLVSNDKCELYKPWPGMLIAAIQEQIKYKSCHIAIVDCEPVIYRDWAIDICITKLRPGGRLIIDNWDQPSVWVPSEETRKLLAPYPYQIYKQDGHPDWQTAVFTV